MLSGSLGEELALVNEIEGTLMARIENDNQEAVLLAKQKVLDENRHLIDSGDDDDAIEMMKLLESAEGTALAQSKSHELSLSMMKKDEEVFQMTRAAMEEFSMDYVNLARDFTEELSKGLSYVRGERMRTYNEGKTYGEITENPLYGSNGYNGYSTIIVEDDTAKQNPDTANNINTLMSTMNPQIYKTPKVFNPNSNAVGLNRVPYDNYLTYLHEGEQVLTKNEVNKKTISAPIININITNNSGNSFDITNEIITQLQSALQTYGG